MNGSMATIQFWWIFLLPEVTVSDDVEFFKNFQAFILTITYTFHNPIVCVINMYFFTLQIPTDKQKLYFQQNLWMFIWQHSLGYYIHGSQRVEYTQYYEFYVL